MIAGLLLVLFGRRLFWIFVGAVGFFAGLRYGGIVFSDLGEGTLILLSLALGVVGALLAIVLQRVAVMLAGGVAGGILAVRLAPLIGLHTEAGQWMAFVVVAALVAVVLSVIFDPALIVLSALMGAYMMAEAMNVAPSVEFVALVILFGVGLFVQTKTGPALDRLRRR